MSLYFTKVFLFLSSNRTHLLVNQTGLSFLVPETFFFGTLAPSSYHYEFVVFRTIISISGYMFLFSLLHHAFYFLPFLRGECEIPILLNFSVGCLRFLRLAIISSFISPFPKATNSGRALSSAHCPSRYILSISRSSSLTSGSAARPVLVSRASRSALASYRKVTTCRCLCYACWGCAISADSLCLPLQDDPASRPQGRVLGT